jgi:hypothetical protein
LRVLAIVAVIGVLGGVVYLSRGTLLRSLGALGHLDWRWFLLAICCECVSLSAFGLSRRRLLRAEGNDARFGSVMAITYASNALSMSVPVAGAQLAVLFSYRQFRRRGLDPALTSWALAVSAIASSSALALLLVAGALASGAPFATAAGFAGAAVFLVPGLAVLFAVRYHRARTMLLQLLTRLVGITERLLHRHLIEPDAVEAFLDRVASIRLTWPRYTEVFLLAVLNWVADCGCLACAILAAGQPVPWHGLLLAYGAGATAGSTGVTPGGFALVEIALTAALVASGMSSGGALTAVLAYRLVNFWLILLGGGIAMIVLSRSGRIRRYARPDRRGQAAKRPAAEAAGQAGAGGQEESALSTRGRDGG